MPKHIQTLADIEADVNNPNAGSQQGIEFVAESVRKYGAGRSILVDKKGRAIAGNKTLIAARRAGLEVEVVVTEGDKLVVVQRTDLDLEDPEARALSIADNRASQVGLVWGREQLARALDVQKVDMGKLWPLAEMKQMFGLVATLPPFGTQSPGTDGTSEETVDGEEETEAGDSDTAADDATAAAEAAGDTPARRSVTRDDRQHRFEFVVDFDDAIAVDRAIKEWEATGKTRGAFLLELVQLYLRNEVTA